MQRSSNVDRAAVRGQGACSRAVGHAKRRATLAALIAALVTCLVAAPGAAQTVQVEVAAVGSSGVSALAILGPAPSGTAVQILAVGAAPGTIAIVHAGTCDAIDPIAVGLIGDVGATGSLQTTIPVGFDLITGSAHVIVLYEALDLSKVLACGPIPVLGEGSPSPGASPAPSAGPSAAPDLATLFPTDVGGEALVVRSVPAAEFSGPFASIEGGPGAIQAVVDLLTAQGRSLADLEVANAVSSGYDPFFNIFAFRVRAIDGQSLADVIKPLFPLMFDEAMSFVETEIGGKSVTFMGSTNKYLYVTDGAVFVVIADEPELSEVLQKLP
jgi:hypothetical protein